MSNIPGVKPLINVAMCSKNRPDSMVFTLYTLIQNSQEAVFRVFVALDIIEDMKPRQKELLSYLGTKADIVVIDNRGGNKATGIKKIYDELLRYDDRSYLLICDDDFIIEPRCIIDMHNTLANTPSYGIVEAMHPEPRAPMKYVSEIPPGEDFNNLTTMRHDFYWNVDTVVESDKIGGLLLMKFNLIEGDELRDNILTFGEDEQIGRAFHKQNLLSVSRTGAVCVHLGAKQSHFADIYATLPPKNFE